VQILVVVAHFVVILSIFVRVWSSVPFQVEFDFFFYYDSVSQFLMIFLCLTCLYGIAFLDFIMEFFYVGL